MSVCQRDPLGSRGVPSGRVAPQPRGGDRRSARIEFHAAVILGLQEKTPDITLAGVAGGVGCEGDWRRHRLAVAVLRAAADHA